MGYLGAGSAGCRPDSAAGNAGVAWAFSKRTGGQSGQGGAPGAGLDTSGAGFGPAPAPAAAAPLPPLPAVGASVAAPMSDATRMVRLALSAAQADGALGPQERETVLARARESGMAEMVEQELQQPRPLAGIVAGVTDPAQRATLYNLAFAVVRADEQVGGAERIYLAQLANLLGLDPATVQQLESAASAKIDATPEAQGQGPRVGS
jgi:uncharacterized membrane protein YebE (DUF533 family)